MKKLSAALLALVLVLSLAACGGTAATTTTTAKTAESTAEQSQSAAKTAATTLSGDDGTDGNVLRVGMECAYAPYNWTQTDASNGAVKIADSSDYAYGYDVMMAKYLAEKMGYTVEVHKMEWNSLIPAVQSGTIDCVIAGQSITSERLETVDFTDPYYYASIVVLVKSDSKYASAAGLTDLKGASATSQMDTVWYNTCIDQIPDVSKQTAMEDVAAMITALTSGSVDVVVTDKPTALAAVASDPTLKELDFTGKSDNFQVSAEEINIGISVKKGNSVLLSKLNAGLSTLTTADFDSWMNTAISVQPLSQS